MEEKLYTKDILTTYGAEALAGLNAVCSDLIGKASGAASLEELYAVHCVIGDMSITTPGLDPDEYGVIRSASADGRVAKSDIYLGNRFGIWTATLSSFESAKMSRPDAYMVALNQYRDLLLSNLKAVQKEVLRAVADEERESRLSGVRGLLAKRAFPRRPKGLVMPAYVHPSGAQPYRDAYVAAARVNAKRYGDLMADGATAGVRLADEMKGRGMTSFALNRNAFSGHVPALTDERGQKYVADNVYLDGETPVVILKAEAGEKMMLTFPPGGTVRASYNTGGLREWQADYPPRNLAPDTFLASLKVNLDWQNAVADRQRKAVSGAEELSPEQSLDVLREKFREKDFRMLFPPRDRIRSTAVIRGSRKEFRFGEYEMETVGAPGPKGGQAEVSRNRVAVHSYDVGTGELRSMSMLMMTPAGERPDGIELTLGPDRRVESLRVNRTDPFTDRRTSSNSLFFRSDGTVDRDRTIAREPDGDFILDYGGLLGKLGEQKRNTESARFMETVVAKPSGSLALDTAGYTFIDPDGRDLLNGLRLDGISEPVRGVAVAKCGDMFTLVDMDRMRPVDLVMRPYTGAMTPDGWALVRDDYNAEKAERYNYVNAAGEKLSVRGFDYATEFRDGRATVFVGRNACTVNADGIVEKVEVPALSAGKTLAKEESRGMHL